MQQPLVSITVCTYNGEVYLHQLLCSLEKLNYINKVYLLMMGLQTVLSKSSALLPTNILRFIFIRNVTGASQHATMLFHRPRVSGFV